MRSEKSAVSSSYAGEVVCYGLFACGAENVAIATLKIDEIGPDDAICIAIQKDQRPAGTGFGLQIGIRF